MIVNVLFKTLMRIQVSVDMALEGLQNSNSSDYRRNNCWNSYHYQYKIVNAGNRGVLLSFGAVDTSRSLSEGLYFVIPVRNNVVQMKVSTQKIVDDAASASGDFQEVRTQVALNYYLGPDNVQFIYKELGPDYANRVIALVIKNL
jgi:hypothetical protein